MVHAIVIGQVEVRCDHEGRFCINDLHRASGGDKRHQPSNWVNLQQTQALIKAIERAAAQPGSTEMAEPLVSRQRLGTFVTRSLVYAYAMWISPEFHLQVIQAYDDMQMRQLKQKPSAMAALPDFNDPVAAARAWADEAEKVRSLARLAKEQREHLEAARPALEFAAAVADSADTITLGQFAKLMGTGELRLFELLRSEKILITGGARHNLPYQKHIDQGRFRVNESVYMDADGNRRLRFQTRITPKGQAWLQQTYFPRHKVANSLELFEPSQLPAPIPATESNAPRPVQPVPDPADGKTAVDIQGEIERLRQMGRLMRQGGSLNAVGSFVSRPQGIPGPAPMRLAQHEFSNDPLGDLAHPDHIREARIRARQR